MNDAQRNLENMGVFEKNRLQEKIRELERHMNDKMDIKKGFSLVSGVWFIAGVLFFIGDGVSLIAFMGIVIIGIWLQIRTEDRLRDLSDVSMTQYVIAEEKKPNEKDMFASMSAQHAAQEELRKNPNDLLKRHPERYNEPQCTGKDA